MERLLIEAREMFDGLSDEYSHAGLKEIRDKINTYLNS